MANAEEQRRESTVHILIIILVLFLVIVLVIVLLFVVFVFVLVAEEYFAPNAVRLGRSGRLSDLK
jgi:heme/copper-type cytochrome/quinol oxidase subunit 2